MFTDPLAFHFRTELSETERSCIQALLDGFMEGGSAKHHAAAQFHDEMYISNRYQLSDSSVQLAPAGHVEPVEIGQALYELLYAVLSILKTDIVFWNGKPHTIVAIAENNRYGLLEVFGDLH